MELAQNGEFQPDKFSCGAIPDLDILSRPSPGSFCINQYLPCFIIAAKWIILKRGSAIDRHIMVFFRMDIELAQNGEFQPDKFSCGAIPDFNIWI